MAGIMRCLSLPGIAGAGAALPGGLCRPTAGEDVVEVSPN